MRHLFSTKLRIILVVAVLLSAALAVVAGVTNQTLPGMIVQGILAPFRGAMNGLTNLAEQYYSYMFRYESLVAENQKLKADMAQMEDVARQADAVSRENERLRKMIGLQSTHESYKTVDAYIKAKKSFFDGLGSDAFALVNADDKVGAVMLQNCAARHYTYSLRTLADFKAQVIEERLDGSTITLNGKELEVAFTGRFNVYNLAAVYGVAVLLGFDAHDVAVKTSLLKPVQGRFQTLRSPRGYVAVVDYAHTPDALVNVLSTIHDVLGSNGKVITVCGCGGNRDKGKRPIMAAEAANRSHQVILTSDNPRNEDPDEIIREMEAGLSEQARRHVLKITDRKEAIKAACQFANPGDVVLVAGKGHETYQEINGVKHHFDDTEVLTQIFNHEQ